MAGLAVEALAHMLLVHATRRVLPSLAMGVAAGAVACAACITFGIDAYAPGAGIDAALTACAAAISFLALSFCFWVVINLNTTAIRVRLLRELWTAPNRRLAISALNARYNAETIVATRIRRLEERGHIKCAHGFVTLEKPTLLAIASLVDLTRRLIIPAQRGR